MKNVVEAKTDEAGKVTGLVFDDETVIDFPEDEQLLIRRIEGAPEPYKISPEHLYTETERLYFLKANHLILQFQEDNLQLKSRFLGSNP